MPVPNKFPRLQPTTYRLAVIGEAPGETEVQGGEPFVGTAGRLLRASLANVNLVVDQLFFGNICQHQPRYNDITSFDFNGPEVQDGLAQLRSDLLSFRPNCLLLLGQSCLRAFKPSICYPTKRGYHIPLSDWRGSIFRTEDIYDCKAVATYHPSYILRAYSDIPYFKFDIARSRSQSAFPEIKSRVRTGLLTPSLTDVVNFCDTIRLNKTPVAFDIEGYADGTGVTMISICPTPDTGIVIPFWIGHHYWSEADEVVVWRALAGLLADPNVPKSAHNAFYELFVLAWRHRCLVLNLHDDTMMKGWELQPELSRSLATMTSLYTEEPYYKDDRENPDPTIKLDYNFKDSGVTIEINEVQESILDKQPARYAHYRFNVELIYPVTYMMLRGCRYDIDKAREIEKQLTQEIEDLQVQIDAAILEDAVAAGVVSRKRKSDPYHFNAKSVPQKKWLLYDYLGYKINARRGDTTNEVTLLDYWVRFQNPVVRLVIQQIRKRTRLSDLHKLVTNDDGRIRASYDLVNTDTGRSSSRASQAMRLVDTKSGIPVWEETGTNLQNVTKELRVGFTADSDDFHFAQWDLSGADGWTVAADLAALGFPTMLDDYLAGIKPALVLYVMLREKAEGRDPAVINTLDRTTLRQMCRAVKADLDTHAGNKDASGRPYDWQYLCCKRVQHGSNYGARPDKIAEVIFKDSDGQIVIAPHEAGLYQYYYKLRYQTDARNQWIERELRDKGYLTAACGIQRKFHSIRYGKIDDAVIRAAASFEPQANTTYATNRALWNLYYDVENRRSNNSLFVEPLLQVHDALGCQYRKSYHDWASKKFVQWFDVPLVIHGIQVTIPAEGNYGPNWRDCKYPYES